MICTTNIENHHNDIGLNALVALTTGKTLVVGANDDAKWAGIAFVPTGDFMLVSVEDPDKTTPELIDVIAAAKRITNLARTLSAFDPTGKDPIQALGEDKWSDERIEATIAHAEMEIYG